jgi:hypothetical protein
MMKLRSDFITHTVNDETLLVPLGNASFHGIVRGNPTLGAIVELLKQETTEEAVVEAMCREYDAPKERIAADVHRVVEKLRSIGAIEE